MDAKSAAAKYTADWPVPNARRSEDVLDGKTPIPAGQDDSGSWGTGLPPSVRKLDPSVDELKV